ncbi:MAG TPA: hypothetical protein VMV92_38810 [Streptosporangiaceae bacterium]|nr:hypothetical protein [Streptosporangiaceae bacterium]
MDFAEMFRVLGRRWRVTVPGLVLTALVTVVTYAMWPATYTSNAEMSLIGSGVLAAQPGVGGNPYLALGNLAPISQVLASNLSSDAAASDLKSLGVTDPYTAIVPPFSGGPFITVTVTGKSSTEVSHAVSVILGFAAQRLITLQEATFSKTAPKALVKAVVIAPPSTPSKVTKTKIEAVSGVAILGFVVTYLLAFSAEARARRRSRMVTDRGAAVNGADGGYARPDTQLPEQARESRESWANR